MELTAKELSMLNGEEGAAKQFAMTIIVKVAEALDAPRLQEITAAHVVDTLTTGTGETGPDFARKLRDMQAKVAVPTTINVGNIDLKNPQNNRPAEYTFEVSREVMDIFKDMGCSPTYTCSPFQEPQNQLAFGQHVAWGESSAIPYANSVFGARTNRYGQFITSAAAITGRVPYSGLHITENRRGEVVITLEKLPREWLKSSLFYHVLGYHVGKMVGEKIPVIVGMEPDVDKDKLKAFGAAAATSGGIGMFHIVGVTPEANTLEAALQNQAPEEEFRLEPEALIETLKKMTQNEIGEELEAVCLGAPHLSLNEVEAIYDLLEDINWELAIPLYIAMSRRTLETIEERGWKEKFDQAEVVIVVDRCVYFAGILWDNGLRVMTDSAKWAHYAPKCIEADVSLGSFADCIASAKAGKVIFKGLS